MDLNAASKRYGELHAAWAEVHVEALEARRLCTVKYASGEGPTLAELDRAESPEAEDERLRGEMDEFVGSYFGD